MLHTLMVYYLLLDSTIHNRFIKALCTRLEQAIFTITLDRPPLCPLLLRLSDLGLGIDLPMKEY